jgi:hypothetical protein
MEGSEQIPIYSRCLPIIEAIQQLHVSAKSSSPQETLRSEGHGGMRTRDATQIMLKRIRGCQYQYTGHFCTFMQNNVRFIDTLPSLPAEIDVVVLQPKQDSNQDARYRRQFERDFHDRRSVVEIWLRAPKRYRPDYKYVSISNERLQQVTRQWERC